MDKKRRELVDVLRTQIGLEDKLLRLYDTTHKNSTSPAVKRLLHMIQLDSKKHKEICELVIEVLHGDDVLKAEKEEIIRGLQRHIELEQEAVDRANKVLRNSLIQETEGLKALIKKWRDDEKDHHRFLKQLARKRFFRVDSWDMAALFKAPEELEERYVKLEKNRRET